MITIISPHSPDIQGEFAALWDQKNPDIKLNWIDQGGTSDDLKYVQSQFQASSKEKGIGADLFFGGGGETFTELQEDGYLQPLDKTYGIPAKLNGVPLVAADKTWVAAALSGFGILYNESIANRDKLPIPQTWSDLANPKLQGRIELADPRHSGSAHTAYEIILQSNGWEKGWKILTGMAGNARAFATTSGAPLDDVKTGDAVFCPAIDFYARKTIGEVGAGKVGYIEPKGQLVVTPDPIAMLAGAPNKEGAQKFIDLVISPEGQKLWYLPKGAAGGPTQNTLYRLPALPSCYKPIPKGALATSDPYAAQNGAKYDSDLASARRRALDDLIGTILVDNVELVKKAWAKNPDIDKTGFVPLPEKEFMAIAKKWDDPAFTTKTKTDWNTLATQHFGS